MPTKRQGDTERGRKASRESPVFFSGLAVLELVHRIGMLGCSVEETRDKRKPRLLESVMCRQQEEQPVPGTPFGECAVIVVGGPGNAF